MQKPIKKTGNWLKPLLWHVAVLGLSIVVGYALLVLVNCLPGEWFVQQAMESADVFVPEDVYPLENEYRQSQLDNYTDALMIGEAAFASDRPFENALMSSHLAYDDMNPYFSYVKVWTDHTDADPQLIFEKEYPRYWHGFLVLLKPLLLVFNYKQIRLINLVLLCALFLAVLTLMKRHPKMNVNVMPLVVTALFMIPQAVVKSLQFSTTT